MCSMPRCRHSLDVFTGAASEDAMKAFVETTTVEFAELSQATIEAYVESGEASTLTSFWRLAPSAGVVVVNMVRMPQLFEVIDRV